MNALYKLALAGCAALATLVFVPSSAWAGGAGPAAPDSVYNFPNVLAEFYARTNDSGDLIQLHPTNGPETFLIGDYDGVAPDDVVASYGSPENALFRFNLDTGFVQLASAGAVADEMVGGDLDGTGNDDLAMTLSVGETGTWVFNDSGFLKISNFTANSLAIANVDGTGTDEIIATFDEVGNAEVTGTWIIFDQGATFQKISNLVADVVSGCGDINGDGQSRDEVLLTYGSPADATFALLDGSSVEQIAADGLTATAFGCADLDGAAGDEVIAAFATGTFTRNLLGGDWTQISNSVADLIEGGDLDGTGTDDLLLTFAGIIGSWSYRNNTLPFVQETNDTADTLGLGEISGD